MKIKDIRLIPLVGATPDGGWQEGDGEDDNLHTLVEVITDEGVVGLGSIFTSAKLSEGALGVLRPMLIGESAIEPVRVCEKLHQTTFWQGRGGSITHFISGIDIALWDIFGKVTKQPISRLLGGRYRDKIKPYGSLIMQEPDIFPARLEAAVERGFQAIKIGWGPFGRVSDKMDEAIVKTARETVGPDVELMVDAGGSDRYWPHGYKWALQTAKMLKQYDVVWFEEALRPDDLQGYIKLTENAPLPITSCEVLTRRQSFMPWIEQRAVDYIQPDVTKVGGLSEEYRIAMHAYDHSILFVPHGWNTAVGLAADLQLVAAVPTARWVEYITPAPYVEDIVAEPFTLDADGLLTIPEAPGLGVKWNSDGVKAHSGMELTPSDL
ncbi:MAG: mandelate racemase/muconate lactonizing enzyme family protein [Gemmatimonadetes bacterium]|jgi:L-alanine-DL-glutamate epimerase-like enolase superfamily enzyme|nr:mandelate racemase/muconate lactonizing enzyme family protein [Gemmatimonadota bacterium]MDE0962811.1 mandelate racemase/muconate lactonizing enzyme family protein [Candidatus Latescibacterota bacterium]MBT5449407.1 mandelate racemase/muconate lactonizing enzyme family protein [Gemmatimonadota bacterium]MBT5804269.1 mandelate racemase/muconate lactonizing enzyme family protein [Gemmatimonadota bacterium]MBT6620143.1 mandelate racemase/muconate lactonizing enzyme family protein [Gemmatimonado|tara:strand:- start:771 stop:1910 length:1140 start_codon:yes stop_codon:yes gene_type:complete